MSTADDDLASKIYKLPLWAQQLIRNQRITIERLESLAGTNVPDPWLYSRGSDREWSPLAGRTDLQVRYGPDPDSDEGHFGIAILPGDDAETLKILSINAAILIRPVASNHIEIRLDRD